MCCGAEAPLAEMLRAAQGRLRMHMPGHKGVAPQGYPAGLSAFFSWDTTELPVTDDLFAPQRGIARAAEVAARSAGAGATLPLACGGTAGVQSMILAAVPPGGSLILPRDCHHSVLSACVWGDVQPLFVPPRGLNTRNALTHVDAGDVAAAIAAHPEAAAVLVTRPDYLGVCLDLGKVAAAARAAGMALLVDEAHGAHNNWRAADGVARRQPEAAGVLGADWWVQSAHKTLPALTGGAWLHLRSAENAARTLDMLRMVHTSSPSFPILATADAARAWMDRWGGEALAALYGQIDAFWVCMRAVPTLQNAHVALADIGVRCDPARIVLDVSAHGYTGEEVAAWLAERDVDVEMAGDFYIVLIPSVCDPPDALARVAQALLTLPRRLPPAGPLPVEGCSLPEVSMRLRAAALAPCIPVPLAHAVGRVAARSAGLYPPGVPLIVPGERVTAGIAACLVRGAQTFGLEAGALCCVKE